MPECRVHDTGRSTYTVARSVDVHLNIIWRTTEANRAANEGLRNFRREGRSVRTCASRSVAGMHGALWSLGNIERLHMWCSRLRGPFTRAPKQAEMGAGVGSPIEAVVMHDTARRRDLRKKSKASNGKRQGSRRTEVFGRRRSARGSVMDLDLNDATGWRNKLRLWVVDVDIDEQRPKFSTTGAINQGTDKPRAIRDSHDLFPVPWRTCRNDRMMKACNFVVPSACTVSKFSGSRH